MEAIALNDLNFTETLSEAERVLKSGGIIICPTDTVYGILGDATKKEAIRKTFEIKEREKEKAFPVFVKDIATARKYAYISDEKAKFLEKVWPGQVTVIFQHKEKFPKILTGGRDTLGLRIPAHKFLLDLLSRLDFPLVQTSANISGKPTAKNIKEVEEYFRTGTVKPDLIIDGGELVGKSSTIIDFTEKEPIVLRTGLVTKAELDTILGNI